MTLASRFSSMRHSRRLTRTGACRNRTRTFHRRASFEALEDRLVLSTASFAGDGESVNESNGGFSIPVSLSSPPSGTPIVSTFASGTTGPESIAFDDAGNLYVGRHRAVPPHGDRHVPACDVRSSPFRA
jgi:hypothetical protein